MINQRDPNWFAFVTRPRHEKKSNEFLQAAGIEAYLPLQKSLNKWKDRKKWVETPLFSCYIFAFIPYIDRYEVLKGPSIVRIVGFNNMPMPVQVEEIDAIKTIMDTEQTIKVVNGPMPGDKVSIKSGPLAGMEGVLVDFRGDRWFVVYIEAVGKSVLVDVNEQVVEKVI